MSRRNLTTGCACILLAAVAFCARAGQIHEAIRTGDAANVREILRNDPSTMNARDEGRTRDYPIHTAAAGGSVEIARLLLEAGAAIEAEDADGSTPLHCAALARKEDMVRFLLERGADVNRRDKNGAYSLSFAASAGDSAIVRLLLDRGADLNYINRQNLGLLHMACSRGMWWFADRLIANGDDINQASAQGTTPLHLAAQGRRPEHVRELLARGARVDVVDEHGSTPLHGSCWSDQTGCMQALLEHGADPNAADSVGLTPLVLAARSSNPEMVRTLLAAGAKTDVVDRLGRTPLQSAVDQGNAESVAMLLDAGAGLTYQDPHGYNNTLLHLAAEYGYADVVRRLLAAGADPGVRNAAGRTPLELARQYGNAQVVHVLEPGPAEPPYHAPRLSDLPKLREGSARIWYLGHSGWAVKTRNHLLIFDAASDPARFGQASDDPGLCNGAVDAAEIAGERVIFFASHGHTDHFGRGIFDLRANIPRVRYVLGFRPEGVEGYEFLAPRETKVVDGVKIHAIESNDTGVGFFVEADGVTMYHAGDHANRARDMSGPFKAEIDWLVAKGLKTDLAFLPVSGCNFGDQIAVRIGNDYVLDAMKPKTFLPMHGGKGGKVYADYIRQSQERHIGVRMLGAMSRGDQFQFVNGKGDLATRS